MDSRKETRFWGSAPYPARSHGLLDLIFAAEACENSQDSAAKVMKSRNSKISPRGEAAGVKRPDPEGIGNVSCWPSAFGRGLGLFTRPGFRPGRADFSPGTTR
jgi:hypothetical protein